MNRLLGRVDVICIRVSGIAICGAAAWHNGPHDRAEAALEGGLREPCTGPFAADRGRFLEVGGASEDSLESIALGGSFMLHLFHWAFSGSTGWVFSRGPFLLVPHFEVTHSHTHHRCCSFGSEQTQD